jgi:hypothetical protein
MELLHHSDVLYSSALQFYCVWQLSLCRAQWNGCVKGFSLLQVRAEYYCVLQLKVLNRSGNMKVANGALAAIFSSFWC